MLWLSWAAFGQSPDSTRAGFHRLVSKYSVFLRSFGATSDNVNRPLANCKLLPRNPSPGSGVLPWSTVLRVARQWADLSLKDLEVPDNFGIVNYNDFLTDVETFQRNMQESAMWFAFSTFDLRCRGEAEKRALLRELGDDLSYIYECVRASFPNADLDTMLQQLEQVPTSMVSFEELLGILRRAPEAAPWTCTRPVGPVGCAEGKKAELKGSLSWKLYPGDLHLQYQGGGGVREILQMLKRSDGFQVLGVSYFGNEHITTKMHIKVYKPLWQELFEQIRQKCDHAVFFMGGYSKRYGYGPVYDDNMGTIREWIADAGLAVRTDFDKVRDWPLGDDLHFAASVKDDLVRYWADLLWNAPPIRAHCSYERYEPVAVEPKGAGKAGKTHGSMAT
ncbi:unnamed protein product [Effrenium voratum]|nr:unnamed protein product [Effrenium voratum]